MKLFGKFFGVIVGLIFVLHGIALAALHSPLVATSNKRGAILYFITIEQIFGETVAWVLSGLLWVALGSLLVYVSAVPAKAALTQEAGVSSPVRTRGRKRRNRVRGERA